MNPDQLFTMTEVAEAVAIDLRTQLAEYRPLIRRHLLAMVHDPEAPRT